MTAGPASGRTGDADSSRDEAAIFARYLLGGREPPPAPVILDRYAEGCARLFTGPVDSRDRAVVSFARRHPWSLPWLDAACALVRPQSSLRGRLILMLAILETAPEHAPTFLAAPRTRASALFRLARLGAAGAVKAALGLLLLPLAGASR